MEDRIAELEKEVAQLKTGYDRTTGKEVEMDCPKCSSENTWRIKSIFTPGFIDRILFDLTEELWECKDCKVKWNYEQKITIVRAE